MVGAQQSTIFVYILKITHKSVRRRRPKKRSSGNDVSWLSNSNLEMHDELPNTVNTAYKGAASYGTTHLNRTALTCHHCGATTSKTNRDEIGVENFAWPHVRTPPHGTHNTQVQVYIEQRKYTTCQAGHKSVFSTSWTYHLILTSHWLLAYRNMTHKPQHGRPLQTCPVLLHIGQTFIVWERNLRSPSCERMHCARSVSYSMTHEQERVYAPLCSSTCAMRCVARAKYHPYRRCSINRRLTHKRLMFRAPAKVVFGSVVSSLLFKYLIGNLDHLL